MANLVASGNMATSQRNKVDKFGNTNNFPMSRKLANMTKYMRSTDVSIALPLVNSDIS